MKIQTIGRVNRVLDLFIEPLWPPVRSGFSLTLHSRLLWPILPILCCLLATPGCTTDRQAEPGKLSAKTIFRFNSKDAVQGVAADEHHFYAINNVSIAKHRRSDGLVVAKWHSEGSAKGITHLNGGMVFHERLYLAHSNWPDSPVNNTVEVWDTKLLEHSHTFGLSIGSGYINWINRYKDYWWIGVADYNIHSESGYKASTDGLQTRVLKLTDDFRVLDSYRLPTALLHRFYPMSNSGAAWSPDGHLYLTGHDRAEAYIVELPAGGDVLDWQSVISLPDIRGQGITWDRYGVAPQMFGINRAQRQVIHMRIFTD